MPQAAPKPCMVCRALVPDGSSRCDKHKLAAWRASPTAVKRTTGRKLQRQRAELFTREPLCRICKAAGRVTPAVVRDHIVNLAEGGTDTDDNLQPLCNPCHDAKTKAEAQRGRSGSVVVHRPMGEAGQKSGASARETDLEVKFLRARNSGGGGCQ